MTPENKQKLLKVGIIALVVLLVCNVCFTVFNETQHRNELTRLRNEVAARDHTIEVANGVYTKLALESSALKGLLDDKTTEVDALQKQLKKTGDELLSVNKVAIRWKKAYESVTEGQQTPVPPVKPGDPERTKVEFAQAFGFLKVSGYTLTDPPEAFLRLEQVRALQLSLVLTQDKTGAWRSYVTSNDPNSEVDIQVAAVNPRVLEPKWYENIALTGSVSGGQAGAGFGALLSVGGSYRLSKFDIGLAFSLGISDRLDKYLTVTFGWRPFERTR